MKIIVVINIIIYAMNIIVVSILFHNSARPNNIEPKFLIYNSFNFKYALEEALFDWKKSVPKRVVINP